MSSTDDARLRRFYAERLEPAARRLRERGTEFFPLGPDLTATTYYVAPPTGPDFSSLDEEPWKASRREQPRHRPMQARVGDTAIFFRKAAVEITFEERKYLVVPLAAILVLVREDLPI